MERFKQIVIGAGASGLFFASACSIEDTLILEKNKYPARKLLMSGGGMCNLTNSCSIKEFLLRYGKNGKAIRSLLYKHNNLDFMSHIESLGLSLITREDGKVFPKSLDAGEVLNCLLKAANKNGVQLLCEKNVIRLEKSIEDSRNIFSVFTEDGSLYQCENLIIAGGGASYPTTGSDGSLLKLLERDLGIRFRPLSPALTPIFIEDYHFSEISGVGLKDVHITINTSKKDNRPLAKSSGDLLFTHKGLSGPVILNNSRYMKPGNVLVINYLYPKTREEALQQIREDLSKTNKSLSNYLSDTFTLPKSFVEKLLDEAFIDSNLRLSGLSKELLNKLLTALCSSAYVISGLGGYSLAMVSSGGIPLEDINLKTMEHREIKNLYFIGEICDIDGDTGGFNLQFAYSSAMAVCQSLCSENIY